MSANGWSGRAPAATAGEAGKGMEGKERAAEWRQRCVSGSPNQLQ